MEPNKTALFLFKKKTVNKKECVASISVTSNICGIFIMFPDFFFFNLNLFILIRG